MLLKLACAVMLTWTPGECCTERTRFPQVRYAGTKGKNNHVTSTVIAWPDFELEVHTSPCSQGSKIGKSSTLHMVLTAYACSDSKHARTYQVCKKPGQAKQVKPTTRQDWQELHLPQCVDDRCIAGCNVRLHIGLDLCVGCTRLGHPGGPGLSHPCRQLSQICRCDAPEL